MSENVRDRNCVLVYVHFYCVYWSEMLCAHFYVPPIRACMRDACMNPDVEFTVSKIVFYDFFYHAWNQVYKRIELFTRL